MMALETVRRHAVILDTFDDVKEFEKMMAANGQEEHMIAHILDELVDCLSDESMADFNVREFAAKVEFGEYVDDANYFLIDPSMAIPIRVMGDRLRDIVNELGLYDEQGNLNYTLKLDEMSMAIKGKDMILVSRTDDEEEEAPF